MMEGGIENYVRVQEIPIKSAKAGFRIEDLGCKVQDLGFRI